ncbi:hypothetical protein PENVUL_c023G08191 [Penicillium vulpinum]|uniref:Uncharacterized protein n=1 Tax=Penicillium vulpinum TaxID=29845 RepID=A0A1V6RV28_9EURO|nr:hypothetical protein PENVUL_c023G08191 [Penicillium vulpinum]
MRSTTSRRATGIPLSVALFPSSKRDLEAGGPGQGTLKTRKSTRRAEDSSIVVRPSPRQIRTVAATRSPISANPSSQETELRDEEEYFHNDVPLSPPRSGTEPTSMSIEDTDPFLASLVPTGTFEPYVESLSGQFDAADRSFGVQLDGIGDYFGMDTGMDDSN